MRLSYNSRAAVAVLPALIIFLAFTCVSFASLSDDAAIEYHYQNGVKYYNRGLYDKAESEFAKTLSMDPAHQEAKDYLEKARAAKSEKKEVDVKKSDKQEIRELYDEGSRLYAKRDYEAALEVFKKILEIKPIDDFASFYKERCEIFISRKLAKEKKSAEQKQSKEKKEKERSARILRKKDAELGKLLRKKEKPGAAAKEAKPAPEVAKKAKPAPEERKAEKLKAKEEALRRKNELIEEKKKEREDRKLRRQEQKEEKLRVKEAVAQEKKETKDYAREEKSRRLEEKKTKKEEALKEKQEARQEKQEARQKKEEARQEIKNIKEVFVEGVQHYGRRQFTEAVASFQSVIDAEGSMSDKTYTDAAKRMMKKAKARLNQSEKK